MVKVTEFLLSVTYPDGQKHIFQLRPGWNSLGSDERAEIRLHGDGILPEHAVLWLSKEGARIKNLGPPGSFELYGRPVDDEIPLVPGEPLFFGPLLLSLSVNFRRAWVAPPTKAPRLNSHLQKLLRTGLGGYREFLSSLATSISPHESEMAHQRLQGSVRTFGWTALAVVFATLLIPTIENPLAASILFHLVQSSVTVLICFLVMRCRLPFAGRLLMIGAIPVVFVYMPVPSWDGIDLNGGALIIALCLCFLALAGWLYDFAASIEPGRRWPRLRLALLSLLATFWLLGGFLDATHIGRISLVTGLLILAFAWWLAPRFEIQSPLPYPDSELLFRAARRRWGFVVAGRTLAVTLAVFPIFLFLNSLGLEKRLEWEKAPPDAVRSTQADKEFLWFWTLKSRFLRETDFAAEQSNEFYGFVLSQEPVLEEIWKAYEEVALNAENPASYQKLSDLLSDYRIDSAARFNSLLGDSWKWENLRNRSSGLLLLERRKAQAFGPNQAQREVHIAQDLWSSNTLGGEALVPFSRQEIVQIGKTVDLLLWPALLFSLLGGLILWRRGGDSPLARWLGIWHIGVASATLLPLLRFSLPSHVFELWHWALDSPGGNLLILLLVSMAGLAYLLSKLQIVFIPAAAMLVHFYWPSKPSTSTLKSRLATAGKIAIAAGLLSGAFYFALGFFGELSPAQVEGKISLAVWVKAALAVSVLLIAAGYWLRRRAARRNLPFRFSPLMISIFVAVQTLVILMSEGFISDEEAILSMQWLSGLCYLAIAALLWFILRRDFLHIAAVRDLSFLGTFVILPVLFEWSEGLPKSWLGFLSKSSFVSEDGAELLGLVAAVALLPPIHRLLELLLVRASIPEFGRFEAWLRRAVAGLAGALGDAERHKAIDQFFKDCQIRTYSLYSHAGDGILELGYCSQTSQPPTQFRLSPALCSFLTRRNEPVDFDRVALEWPFFFHQFELRRLGDSTGCRYLFPVLLGGTLWGVLLLPDGPAESWLTRHAVADRICSFLVAAVQRHSRTSEPVASPITILNQKAQTAPIAMAAESSPPSLEVGSAPLLSPPRPLPEVPLG